MANRPIPVAQADDMIREYMKYLTQHSIDPAKQTQSISFGSYELMGWLTSVMPYADELRICEGVYPSDHLKAGRITVILWPYKDGKPAVRPDTEGKDGGGTSKIPPFNEGQGNP